MSNKTDSIPSISSALISRISAVLPADVSAFLVGGAVRDFLMKRPTHDLDFVLPGNALNIAKKVANRIGAAYFPLDEERDTARLVLQNLDGSRDILDFSAYRGNDLESDLRARDFTINAMAVDVRHLDALIDPLGGATDLLSRRIRSCSSLSISDDPIRTIRAVRLATALNFQITPETRDQIHQAVPALAHISAERLRDEIFRILDGPQIATALRALDIFGALSFVLPELLSLKGVKQSPPHVSDVWTHSIDAVQKLEQLLNVLDPHYDPDLAANLWMGLVVLRLGRFREQINNHFKVSLNLDRPLRPLLFFATLYHDIGKPETQTIHEDGRIRFFKHDQAGERIVEQRATEMRLSNAETERLKLIIRNHLRPMLLGQARDLPSRRAIYHFFRDTGPAGVEICLLSLADVLATYGPTLPTDRWTHHLNIVRALLESYWETPQETVSPPVLLNGNDLMSSLNIEPGPVVGKLLEAIREATATGQLHTREDALAFAEELLRESGDFLGNIKY